MQGMTELTEKQAELCETNTTDFSDLRALFLSCTLKRSPEVSNTEGLAEISMEIMRRNGVGVELRPRRRPRHRHRRLARHDRARLGRRTSGPRSSSR